MSGDSKVLKVSVEAQTAGISVFRRRGGWDALEEVEEKEGGGVEVFFQGVGRRL